MATISVHEYIARVERLLAAEQYERAIAFCQLALRSLPRCVEFYRLLGQACLESGRPDAAADMFRRVLGADPQSFVARVGLGVMAEGISAFDEAAWQWERALEVEPNHSAIREELKNALARKGEPVAGGRVPLTRAALGYIYMRGEQYERAAAEFQAVLAQVPNGSRPEQVRFDLLVALAEALYRAGHQREAAQYCRQVLQVLPNALKPNLILGEIYRESGRADEAQRLFERAQNLDPENSVAARLLNALVALKPRDVMLDEPGGDVLAALTAPPPSAQPTAPTVGSAQPTASALAPATGATEEFPDWLVALRAQAPVEPEQPLASAIAEAAEPEWLKALRFSAPEAVAPITSIAPAEPEGVPTEAETGAPAWLQKTPATAESPEPAAPTAEPASTTALPDWLASMRATSADAPTETTPEALAAPEPELPDWLRDAQAAQAEPTVADTTTPATEAAPGPIAEHQAPTAAADATAPESPVERPLPDWLRALRESAAQFEAEPAKASAPAGPVSVQAPPIRSPDVMETIEIPPIFVDIAPAIAELSVADTIAPREPTPRARPPREPNVYLDDAAAPRPIEAEEAPTGEAEYAARLELARMLADLDVDEALDQYVQMAGASPALRQSAIDEVTALARTHAGSARARAVLEKLGGGSTRVAGAAPEAVVAPAPVEDVAELPQMVSEEQTALAPSEPVVSEETLEAGAAIPAVESEAPAMPVVDETLIADQLHATPAPARIPAPPAAPPATWPEAPQWVGEAQSNLSVQSPVAAEEPIVEEETLVGGAASEVEAAQPSLPVVDEEMMDELPAAEAAPAPERAAAIPPAPTAEPVVPAAHAPPSIESQAPPSGEDEHTARLELARNLRDLDSAASLAQYSALVEANSPLLAQVIDDLQAVVEKTPAARGARLLLADALSRAGRLPEAVAQYRMLV